MNAIDSIIFDLDGTLWDTCRACAVAWNSVLKRNEVPFREVTEHDVRKVTGQPHEMCIRNVFEGLSEDDLLMLIEETQAEDNKAVVALGGDLYPYVKEGLVELSKRYPLFIVSNCQSGYIEVFLKQTGLGAYFRDIECWGNTREPKAANTCAIIARNNLSNPVFVGDTEGDEQAATLCAIPFFYVSYGFGKCREPQTTFESFETLVRSLI